MMFPQQCVKAQEPAAVEVLGSPVLSSILWFSPLLEVTKWKISLVNRNQLNFYSLQEGSI